MQESDASKQEEPRVQHEQQVRQLFREVLQRDPSADELTEALALLATEQPEQSPPRLTAGDWSYGYGSVNETTGQLQGFQLLPHFTGTSWQGGATHPDGKLGWVQLSAWAGGDLRAGAVDYSSARLRQIGRAHV